MFLDQNVNQIGVIVKDLEKTLLDYEAMGVSKEAWTVLDLSEGIQNPTVKGKDTPFGVKAAIVNLGNTQLELIEPTDENSIHYEFLQEHGEGIHHVLIDVDYDQYIQLMEEKGEKPLCTGALPQVGVQFAYFDTRSKIGLITEVVKKIS